MNAISNSFEIEKLIEKLVNMEIFEVPVEQILLVTGLDQNKYNQIRASEQYKILFQEKINESMERISLMNDGWDMVENTSLNNVLDHLQHSPDPEYSLKAAALANRAKRRGGNGQNRGVINPESRGVKTAIILPIAFVEKLQDNFQVSNVREQAHKELAKKDEDFLAPAILEGMFAKEKVVNVNGDEDEQESDLFNLGLEPNFA